MGRIDVPPEVGFPDFFIVGAPKCGTTSFYRYLRDHPEIFMPTAKEPHFFGEDLVRPEYLKDADRYLQLFDEASGSKLRGEASVWYLFSRTAAQEISRVKPDAKIIVLLRHPVDAMESLHRHLLYNGSEVLESFPEAFRVQVLRKQGLHLPDGVTFPQRLLYADVVAYSHQVQRYIDTFGSANVHVIIFEEFLVDKATIYRGLLRFLGVASDVEPDWRIHNQAKSMRSRAVGLMLAHPPKPIKGLLRQLLPGSTRRRIWQFLWHLNLTEPPASITSPRFRAELCDLVEPEIDRLVHVLGRDIPAWRERTHHLKVESTRSLQE
jgi:hypothetical protein